MMRTSSHQAGLTAAVVAAATTASIVVVLSVVVLADLYASPHAAELAADSSAARQSNAVDRTGKSDPLPLPVAKQARIAIKSVEVVGIRDAAIVYRDRNGSVLYRTDPVTNVTIIAKNVDLPEVTVRDNAAAKVNHMSIEGTAPDAPPVGCESSFARPSPAELTRVPSRCLADTAGASDVAALP